jgi:transposase
MDKWCKIRERVLREGESIREIQRETGLHFNTVKRILDNPSPPPFQTPEREATKLGAFKNSIAAIIQSDKEMPKKQRHTAKRIYELLRDEGYSGCYVQVAQHVKELKKTSKEVFVPLVHEPGEAQMDFGFAVAHVAGELRKIAFFAMSLPHSDAMHISAYPRECTETFQDGHVRAFNFFGGVPRCIRYDNAKTTVSQITGSRTRKLTDGFLQLKSHYLFDSKFCLVRRPNEKGVVEGIVKYARQNYLVPVPEVADFEELNAYLEECCRADLERTLRGKKVCKQALLDEERSAFLPLPETPFEACKKASTAANSLSLVRFDCNDYSVPVEYAHHTVVVKGFAETLRISQKTKVIAEHHRLWDKEDVAFNPVHYLQLLERKPGALDHARPLSEWELPECFDLLKERMEEQGRQTGTREFIRVLRLLEKHPMPKVEKAIGKALRNRFCNRDVVAQFLYPDELKHVPTFSLEGREHLQGIQVAMPDINAYQYLIAERN